MSMYINNIKLILAISLLRVSECPIPQKKSVVMHRLCHTQMSHLRRSEKVKYERLNNFIIFYKLP